MGRRPALLFRHRGITATASAAVMVFIAGGAFAAVTPRPGHQTLANTGHSTALTHKPTHVVPPVGPLEIVSVSPAGGASDANGGAPITVTFSSALAPLTPLPALSPKIAGSWQVAGKTATFTPSYGYLPDTKVTLKIPGGVNGMQGLATLAGVLSQPRTVKFTTGSFSTLRL